ncbi:type IV pilin accessory protein [Pseudomonas stutzeri]|uniref:TfpX/TfpZ family type IV pilin accessory protein n=1 Tax=Stutzerimonas stutzeri TaxID=316 RepID=UPI00210CB31E|nr:TfpX/TfpZ family type IV pilin accessory protein [Stutzerimonas stutzeri]MCQ4314060.1 type IV pilin accessory protein [Stutzerimonas stutzeri]
MSNPRIKAFSLHLLLSACLALAVVCLVFFIWYPNPLHTALGVTKIFLMLIAIDVVLGPCLTLLVYKQSKKTLVMDLSIICVLQLGALLYGLHAVADGRPAWLVFADDRFHLVRANDIDGRKLDEAKIEYRSPSWMGPKWVSVLEPESADEKSDLLFESVLAGVDISQRPNLYQPLSNVELAVQKAGKPLALLEKYNTPKAVEVILQTYPKAGAWLPLKANQKDMVVLLRENSGEVIAIVNAQPWN